MPDDYSDDQLKSYLLSGAVPSDTDSAAPAPVDNSAAIAGLPSAITAGFQSAINRIPGTLEASGNLNWFDRNQRKDDQGRPIPIDIKSGIDLGDYARMVLQRRPEERLVVLQKIFPNNTVRQTDTGDLIVGQTDAGGNQVDVLVNPAGFDSKDLLEIGSSFPEIASAGTGAKIGGSIGSLAGPIGRGVGTVAGAAIASGLAGAAKDTMVRFQEGLPVNAGEIWDERSKQALIDTAFGGAMGAGAKSMRLLSPFASSRGPLEFNLEKAIDYFDKKWGEKLFATPGERLGSTLLRRIEATETPQPGASTILGKLQTGSEQGLTRIVNRALGQVPAEEDLGSDLISLVNKNINQPVENAVAQARNGLIKKGETELVRTIDQLAPSATVKEAGEAARSKFMEVREAAKTAVDEAYAVVRDIPGGSGKVLPGDSVADAAKEILDEIPKVTTNLSKTESVIEGFPPVRKQIQTSAGTQEKILESAVPEGLKKFLGDMQSLKGQKMSLDELTKLKNSAYDEIAKLEAVPEVRDRWFSKVANAYEGAIQKGIDETGDATLKDALTNARETYKTKLLPLDRQGLRDFTYTEHQAGFKTPEELVSRLFSGSKARYNYEVLRDTLGADSDAFKKIKGSLLNKWTLEASDPVTGRINPETFERSLNQFRLDHPEIYKDVVGDKGKQLLLSLRSLKAAGQEIKDVNPDELRQLFSADNVNADALKKLSAAQATRDATYANELIRDVSQDPSKLNQVKPAQFVSSLFNPNTETDKVEYLLRNIQRTAPEKLDDIQSAALYRLFSQAQNFKSEYAPLYLNGSAMPVSGSGLVQALGKSGSAERARNELLLGPENMDLVKNLISYLSPREQKQKLFGAAGSMAATSRIEDLLSKPLKYAGDFTRKALIAAFYTSKPMRALLSNEIAGPQETSALANMLISSEPLIRKVKDVLGEDAAYSVISDAKNSIDRFVNQDIKATPAELNQEELLKFLRGGNAKVKIETK